jgi:hypothetical protein
MQNQPEILPGEKEAFVPVSFLISTIITFLLEVNCLNLDLPFNV